MAGAVQVRLKTDLTGADYVKRQAWLDASGVGRDLMRRRAEEVERSIAHMYAAINRYRTTYEQLKPSLRQRSFPNGLPYAFRPA